MHWDLSLMCVHTRALPLESGIWTETGEKKVKDSKKKVKDRQT